MAQQRDHTRELFQSHLQRTEAKCIRVIQENPTWPQSDARRQVLERLWYVTASVMGLTIAATDSFTHGRWWRTKAGLGMSIEQGRNIIQTSQALIRLARVAVSFSMVETTLRKLYEALEGEPPTMGVFMVYKAVLKSACITLTSDQSAAFRLFQLTRNSIHNNSIHSHRDEKVDFAGYRFQFRRGYKVQYADYSILVIMMDHVQDLMFAVVSSAPVKRLPPLVDDPATIPGITPVLSSAGD